MIPISSSSGGTSERIYALGFQGRKAAAGVDLREGSTGSLASEGIREIGWEHRVDLNPFSGTDDPSVWGDSPAPRGVSVPVAFTGLEVPINENSGPIRVYRQRQHRCLNITISTISGLSVAGGSYGLYEIYEKTETDIKIVAFIPLCFLIMVGMGVTVYRGYLGCRRRA